MLRENHRHFRFDWVIIVLYLALIVFGYFNIISASHTGKVTSYFNMSELYGKQLIFIGISLALIIFIFALEAKFFERFASLIYLIAILSLLGLFIFGKDVNGAKSWYGIGGFTIQPSEFAKFATALAVAKFITDIQTNIKTLQDQVKLVAVIFIPALMIVLQNDAGSTLVYLSFFFVFFREGIQKIYLEVLLFIGFVAIISLKFGTIATVLLVSIFAFTWYFYNKRKKNALLITLGTTGLSLLLAFGTNLFFKHGLQQHQQNRITIFLRLETDPVKLEKMKKTEAYNLIQSEATISAGGFSGKGFLQGTRTTGKFVPEQPTDYIFTTVGEEWGFLGSTAVVIVFVTLLIRILYLAESQKSAFSRVYGYSVASILFIHFTINIGMVMGLLPTVGIPLPFFSYGGSSLFAFTILLFIFVKLDSNKINEW